MLSILFATTYLLQEQSGGERTAVSFDSNKKKTANWKSAATNGFFAVYIVPMSIGIDTVPIGITLIPIGIETIPI
ncbi:hypothetical protein [Candidatus Electronema sp. PJ]|uniref:hypothetical protein n=1 Tax=Candidatus Electronema sp. PJ TaxID=3401572 RepID=UPI003AA871F0